MRNRDLLPFLTQWSDTTPQAANFLQFLEQELIPLVETTYRADSTKRVLAGYSFGAFFTLFAVFQQPLLFSRYIAIDGFDDRILAMEEEFASTGHILPIKIFLASGADDMSKLAAILRERSYSELEVEHAQLNDLGHFAVGAEGLTKGLVSVFSK